MSVHLQVGNKKDVGVVFSCPGRHEEANGIPAAKTTGVNLDTILFFLSKKLNRKDLNRADITITNAWAKIEYLKKTQRTEATKKEICLCDNISRLKEELRNIHDFIIFFGNKAKLAATQLIHSLQNPPKFVFAPHPGSRGLLSIKTDIRNRPIQSAGKLSGKQKKTMQRANTKRRLRKVVSIIISQLCY